MRRSIHPLEEDRKEAVDRPLTDHTMVYDRKEALKDKLLPFSHPKKSGAVKYNHTSAHEWQFLSALQNRDGRFSGMVISFW